MGRSTRTESGRSSRFGLTPDLERFIDEWADRAQARGEQLGVGPTSGRPHAELLAGAVVVNSP